MPKIRYKLVKWHFGKYEKIPEDWEDKQIDEMIKFEGGSQPPRSDFVFEPKDGYVRMIQIRDFKTDHYATYIPKKFARRFFEKDDVMIGRYGPPNFQILRGLSGVYNVALIKAVPKNQIEKDYLYYFLKQHKFFNFMDSLGQRTAGQDGVELDLLKKLPFPLPPKKERKQIISILSNMDNLIEKYDSIINSTKLLKKGLMQQLLTKGIGHKKFKKVKWLFGKEIEIPVTWEIKKLNELTKVTDGSHFSPMKISDGFPMATIENIKGNVIDIDSCYRISKESFDQLARDGDKPKIGDILFTKDGTVGKTLVYRQNDDIVLLSSIAIIRKSTKMDSDYCNYLLQSKFMTKHLAKYFGGTAIKRIILKHLSNYEFPLPKLKEQQEIASMFMIIDSKIDRLESKKYMLETLKKGLMQKLLTGQIRVKV